MTGFNLSRKCKKATSFWDRIHPFNPQNLSILAALWFVCTVIGVFYCGLTIVLPLLYASYSPWVLTAHTIFCYFLFAEMMINWACMRFMDTGYSPDKHSNVTEYYNATQFTNGMIYTKEDGLNGAERSRTESTNGTSNKRNDFLVKIPDYSGEIKDKTKLLYPYWSWKPCLECNTLRPPRTHHCPICNKCILKRDHHCFFTGSCVGLYNQRHFVVFAFWTYLATTYCLIHSFIYLHVDFAPRNSWWDVLYPIAFLRWAAGYVNFLDNILVLLLYSLIFFWLTSLGMFMEQIKNICRGLTEFENDNNIKVVSSLTRDEQFYSVFGPHWKYNFLFPLHFKFKTPEDGLEWSHIKM